MIDGLPMDIGIGEAMEVAFQIISHHPDSNDTPDQLRLRVVAHSLRGMANMLLTVDDPESGVKLNIKQFCLGLFGTADWMAKDLPELDIPSPELENGLGGIDGKEDDE